jgi:hypothetical protein
LHGQRLDKAFSSRTTAQATKRFEHGVVRFLASVAFHALSASNTEVDYFGGSLPLEFIDQGRFPDARLPRDKNDLPLPQQGLT